MSNGSCGYTFISIYLVSMRLPNFLLLLLLLLSTRVAAQQSMKGMGSLKQIPREGLVFDAGWKFMPGDDPARADPAFDDSQWTPIDPTDEMHHLPLLRDSEMGWLRLTLNIDSSFQGKSPAVLVSGFGAMEIYLNGKLTYVFGKPSSEYATEKTSYFTNKLLSLTFGNSPRQVLAIRYSFSKKNLYLKFANARPVIKFVIKELNQGFADHLKANNFEATLRAIKLSFYLPLGFLLLFLYMSFRRQKEFFYSGLFCLSLFLAILMHIIALSDPVTVNRSNSLLLMTQVFYIIGAFSFLHSIYILYNRKKSWFFYLIVAYGLFSIPFYFISYDMSGLVNAFFFPVINLEFLRLNIQAVYHRRKGAVILLLTSLLFALAIVSYIIFTVNHQTQAAALLESISYILPGIGLSLFYAGEFARTAVAERQRTQEVEKLSAEMLAREKEKQQILASQNETLEKQVTERTAELSRSLQELKETEEQLIQREKMASLGELTAGIAHEIQNPLNFVNNFSEVNTELIDEMNEDLKKGKYPEAGKIAEDIRQNNEKINYHGKRADSIVKAMLQHSRNSTGLKEKVQINNLVDECLRLSFHGMRAKDKTFNAKTELLTDPAVTTINAVSQDIGRVLLNLFTNAFYAVLDKQKKAAPGFEPLVTASTGKLPGAVQISIRDNGNGVPSKVIDKIFQPFFTTKPTGQGTGLGLSMSYDIVTKGHGGELKVNTREGEFAEFTIILPE